MQKHSFYLAISMLSFCNFSTSISLLFVPVTLAPLAAVFQSLLWLLITLYFITLLSDKGNNNYHSKSRKNL